jgi:hypothetical protein
MGKHLDSCRERKMQIPTTGRTKFFHIVVDGEDASEYWLHLDAKANSKLEDLDRILREIWLECCGHLSAFTINGELYYCAAYMEGPNAPTDKGMDIRLEEILTPGTRFKHEYGFGTTTTLRLRVASERIGSWRRKPILLMARNLPPTIKCDVCGAGATKACPSCTLSNWDLSWLCDSCATKHDCGQEWFLPVVNSPRTGVCGYTGSPNPLF